MPSNLARGLLAALTFAVFLGLVMVGVASLKLQDPTPHSPIYALSQQTGVKEWKWMPLTSGQGGDRYVATVDHKVCLSNPLAAGELVYASQEANEASPSEKSFPNTGCVTPPSGKAIELDYRIFYTDN